VYGVIVGSGRLGSALASLFSQEGHDIVVVDKDPKAFARLGSGFNGTTVLGTGIDEDVLKRAGIERADFLCAMTSSDSVNLMVAQVARSIFHVRKVVARIFDPSKAELYRDLGIEAISTTGASVAEIRNALALWGLSREMSLGAGLLEMVSFTVGRQIDGKTIGELRIPRKFEIIAVARGSAWGIPEAGDTVAEGDRITAVVRIDALEVVRDLLGLTSPRE
jgi:trk system potassium uptake protein TrkA